MPCLNLDFIRRYSHHMLFHYKLQYCEENNCHLFSTFPWYSITEFVLPIPINVSFKSLYYTNEAKFA